MATIEPRLIHLLNDSSTPHLGHADLPSPATTTATTTTTTTITTVAPTSALTAIAPASRSLLASSSPSISLSSPSSSSSLSSCADFAAPLAPLLCDAKGLGATGHGSFAPTMYPPFGDEAGNSSGFNAWRAAAWNEQSRQMRSTTPPMMTDPYLSKVLDCPEATVDDGATKKRRAITVKDDLMQLPQPVKKQKALAQQQQVMPPIINGLHELPHQSTLLPPITDVDSRMMSLCEYMTSDVHNHAQFHHPIQLYGQAPPAQSHPRSPQIQAEVHVETQSPPPPPQHDEPEKSTSLAKPRRRSSKPRRKWSDEETRHLLLGVHKYGVGKWTTILEDDEFSFNNRSAGDLKDRFRTCCPAELRRTTSTSKTAESRLRAKAGLKSENILQDESPMLREAEPLLLTQPYYYQSTPDSPPTPSSVVFSPSSDTAPKQRKSRAHRKKLEELAEMGIHGPFKQSLRRERRAFTEQDDGNILKGLDKYGPAWTKIQRDPQFGLSSRQPTDLRDRVRNKYPDVYQRIEKGAYTTKDGKGDTLDQKPTAVTASSLPAFLPAKATSLVSHPGSASSQEDVSSGHAYDFGEHAVAPTGDMDISKLLIDDSQLGNASKRLPAPFDRQV